MKWTIAFDSGCDLRNFASIPGGDVALELVPLNILLGQQEVVDDGQTSLEELQHRLDERPGKTGTACPSVGDWTRAMAQGDKVLAITISGAVSGSYQSACAARDMLLEEDPDREIFVLNSVSGSGGMQALVCCALDQIERGASFEAVCQAMKDCRSRSEIFFLLQNVDNIMSNGRLNPVIGKAIKALKLKLLATVSPEGTLEVIGKVCSFEKAMDRSIQECLDRGCTPRKVIISHCMNPDGASLMQEKLLARFPGLKVTIMETGLLCGYYAEKGGLIVALEG